MSTGSQKLEEALALTKGILSSKQYDYIEEFLNANELGLALETLVDFLRDDKLPINAQIYQLLKDSGKAMSMKPSSWERLKNQVMSEGFSDA